MFREAISLMEEAISITPEDNVLDRVKYLSQLGQMYALRHNRVGELSDLEYAIKYADLAINEGPDPESYEGYARLKSDISDMYMAKFDYTGQIDALRDGISNAENALSISSDQDADPDPILLAKLAENYLIRFHHDQRWEDLEQALQLMRGAVAAAATGTQKDPSQRARICNGLAAVLAERYERRPEYINDVREAVTLIQSAIDATSTKDVARVNYLLNFAHRLRERFALDRDAKDLHEGIRAVDEAIDFALLGHPRFLDMLRCRAKLFSTLFQVTSDLRHYTKAEDSLRKALDRIPDDHPNRCAFLLDKVDLILLKEHDEGRSTQLWWATEICCQAMHDCPNSPPLDRLKAAYKGASLYLEKGDYSMAGGLLCRGIDLFPLLNPRSLSRDDQQFLLRQFSAMASDAAACFLEVTKQPARALATLESGRGVIASLMINSRSDVSDLEQKDNSLFSRYIELRDAVSRNINEFSNATNAGGAASEKAVANALSRRVQDEHDLHLVEEEIRRLDGFERFQLSPTVEELQDAAVQGHIVVFNIAKWRSDAIIVPKHPSTGIRYVSLPGLKYDELERFTPWVTGKEKMVSGPISTKAERNGKMRELLQYLWRQAVAPVLENLDINTKQRPAADELPRIWWVMSGIMSVFPLHAAGEDWGGESAFENTASHVISSYIPTIKALKYARDKNVSHESERGQSFLIASMPETEGMRPLRVSGEVTAVKQCAVSFQVDRVVAVDTPSREQVLEELKSTRIAHFICHGALDINNPSDSCLLFKQDADSGKAGRLRVRDVAALSMEHAHIAYLSACSTAETADKTLVDETIHLASSFQLVGFPHVVGTTWEANNTVAEKIAKNFYTFLIEQERAFPQDGRSVAYALHKAVKAYWGQSKGRFKPSDDVIAWAPFIHIGM
ncbi:CHAT domain-containing protein [Trichoderma velutinum]